VFTRKLVASIKQSITFEKALGRVKVDPDWDLPDPDEEQDLSYFGALFQALISILQTLYWALFQVQVIIIKNVASSQMANMPSLKETVDGYMQRVSVLKEHCDRCLRTERWGGSTVLMVVDAISDCPSPDGLAKCLLVVLIPIFMWRMKSNGFVLSLALVLLICTLLKLPEAIGGPVAPGEPYHGSCRHRQNAGQYTDWYPYGWTQEARLRGACIPVTVIYWGPNGVTKIEYKPSRG
jgi:hypothetical protein